MFASAQTNINDATKSPNGIGPVNRIGAPSRILHDRTGDHNDIFGGAGKLLDDEMDHLAEAGIFVLEQLRNTEE